MKHFFSNIPLKHNMSIGLFLLYLLIAFFIPTLVLAMMISYMISPFIVSMHKRIKLPYILCLLFTVFILFSAIAACIYMLFHSLLSVFPNLFLAFEQLTDYFTHDALQSLLAQSIATLEQLMLRATSSLQLVFHSILQVLVFMMALIFSLLESKKDRLWFFRYVPKSVRAQWTHYFTKAMSIFSYFLFVEIQLVVVAFLLLAGGFSILKFEAPISKALLIALADCLPFFGIGIFLIPLAVYYIVVKNYTLAVAVFTLYLFVLVTRQIVETKLWAHTFQVRAVHAFFISAASVLLFGLYGIFLSPFLLLLAVKLRTRYF